MHRCETYPVRLLPPMTSTLDALQINDARAEYANEMVTHRQSSSNSQNAEMRLSIMFKSS